MTSSKVQKQPIKVIIDSNAFFVPLQFKIDIFAELARVLNRKFEPILLSPVKRELEALARRPSKEGKDAEYALCLAEKIKYINISEKKDELTDDAIVRVSKAWKAIVFTNDKMLKRKLRDISVPVIYVREKSLLEIDGLIS